MARPTPLPVWPPARPKRVAAGATLAMFVAGLVAMVATGAPVAYFGTLLVGCLFVGVFLATVLDRRTLTR